MRFPRSSTSIAALAVAAAVLTLAACGDDGGGGSSATAGGTKPAADPLVRVNEAEFSLDPATTHVPAGQVTFDVADRGKAKHEFVVIRTTKKADDLLKGKEADETGAVDEIADIGPGAAKRLTLNLKPGHYALICNLPGHYFHDGKPGMLADFTVSDRA
jgi:uncharacterized cupredoxin-like copper-binding protein